jgi:ABC-2 type transport system ATP-binding protein
MGMKQRLGIAVALLNNPASLVLDEPFSGLDPLGIEALQKLIRELAKTNNLTILISSHLVDLLAQTCDVLHVMQQGELVYSGNPSALLAKYTKAYHICGTNIETAQALRAYSYTLQGHCATVSVHTTAISNLLAQLTQEGININSCTPQLDLHQLFNPAV